MCLVCAEEDTASHLQVTDHSVCLVGEEEDTASSEPRVPTKQEAFKQAVKAEDKQAADSTTVKVRRCMFLTWIQTEQLTEGDVAPGSGICECFISFAVHRIPLLALFPAAGFNKTASCCF